MTVSALKVPQLKLKTKTVTVSSFKTFLFLTVTWVKCYILCQFDKRVIFQFVYMNDIRPSRFHCLFGLQCLLHFFCLSIILVCK